MAQIAAAAMAGIAVYLGSSALTHGLGFPLDDSWIHATYARNLALRGQWAFHLGQRSAGSTAPFWTLLLTPGYWLGIAPLWWSYALGLATLVGLGVVFELALRLLDRAYHPLVPWAGIFIALEWHMLWAATSGMETLLHAMLATLVLSMILTHSRKYAAMGLLTGLSTWVRPDGLTLVFPVLAALIFAGAGGAGRIKAIASYLVGFGALFVPYVAFNLWLSGMPMPNTFYAKQAEYAAWQAQPLVRRVGLGLLQLSTGPFLLLWPGLGIWIRRALKTRDAAGGCVLAWCAAYVFVYVLRLPVYQHGRYLMPVMPMLILLGVLGYLEFKHSTMMGQHHWGVNLAWRSSLVLTLVGFAALGAHAYGEDVALIETEMVATARWVASELPENAIIAAHDIGALGYFDQHTLVDLAGLVSPEVVPFIRDQARLALYLDQRHVNYVIAFPDLYPQLEADSKLVYASGGTFAPELGQENMAVYCWRCR